MGWGGGKGSVLGEGFVIRVVLGLGEGAGEVSIIMWRISIFGGAFE